MVESLSPKAEGLDCPVCRDDKRHFAAEGTISPKPGEGQHSAVKGAEGAAKQAPARGMFGSG